MKVAFGLRAHSGWAALVALAKNGSDFTVVDRLPATCYRQLAHSEDRLVHPGAKIKKTLPSRRWSHSSSS